MDPVAVDLTNRNDTLKQRSDEETSYRERVDPQLRAAVSEWLRNQQNSADRKYVAHHEAGHAVAGVLLGFQLVSVTAERVGQSEGLCVFASPLCPCEECIVRLFAGQVAEMRFRGVQYEICGNMGWGADDRLIAEYLECLAEEYDTDQLRQTLRARTERLIENNWEYVGAVASKLCDGKTLTQADMDRIRLDLQSI